MGKLTVHSRRPRAAFGAFLLAVTLTGCSDISADPSTTLDEAKRERLRTILAGEFPDIYEKHVRGKATLTPDELLDALYYERHYIFRAPDGAHLAFLKAGRDWADPQSGACPENPYSWNQEAFWKTLELYVEGKRDPHTGPLHLEAALAAFDAAVVDPQRRKALGDFMRGGIMPTHAEERCRLLYDWFDTLLRLQPDYAVSLSGYNPTWMDITAVYPMAEFNPRIQKPDSDE